MCSVLLEIWAHIKGFVSLGLKTFHHFFLVEWKYSPNYFTRELRVFEKSFHPCLVPAIEISVIPDLFLTPRLFSCSLGILLMGRLISVAQIRKQTQITWCVDAMLWWLAFPPDPSIWDNSMDGSSVASLSKRRQREYYDFIRQWSFSNILFFKFSSLNSSCVEIPIFAT